MDGILNEKSHFKPLYKKDEYNINLTQSEEGMVDTMCNLSVGVFERGWNSAWDSAWNKSAEMKDREIVINLLKKQMDMQFIIDVVNCSASFVRQVAKEENLSVKE